MVPYGPHTVLKLTCVAFYAPMFSMIAQGWSAKSRGYDAAVYLDMFAGPGIVSVGKKEDMVGGSPIAATKTNFPFDFSVFVEIEKDRATILNKRLSTYLPRGGYLVMNGDTNVLVGDVIAEIKKRYKKPIVLAFIDPEGMEAKWKTADALSQAFPNLDFMINVTSGAARVAGKLSNGITEVRPIFDDYFGPNAEKALTDYC